MRHQILKNRKKGLGNLLGGVPNPTLKASDWGGRSIRKGLVLCAEYVFGDRYQKPLFIVENGLGSCRCSGREDENGNKNSRG